MASQKLQEWRHSWPVVLASSVATAISVIHLYSLGVFFAPLEAEFGWSRAQISASLTIVSVLSVVLSPFIGIVIDRLGPRRIGIPGTAIYAAALALLAFTGPSIWSWWAAWLLMAAGSVLMKPTVWTAAVASWFRASRGFAFALVLSGSGVCITLAPAFANWVLTDHGWRAAYLTLAATAALVGLPTVYFLFFSAEDRRRLRAAADRPARLELTGLGVREALLSRRFFQLAFVAFVVTATVSALTVHYVPMVSAAGVPRARAAELAGLAGIFAIAGRLFGGFLMDLIDARIVGAVSISMAGLACVLLLGFDGSGWTAAVIACLIGYALGAETELVSYMVPRYFGRRNFGVIYGTIAGLFSFGTGIGSLLAGAIYDLTGSYQGVMMILIPAIVISVLLVLLMGRPPAMEEAAPELAVAPA